MGGVHAVGVEHGAPAGPWGWWSPCRLGLPLAVAVRCSLRRGLGPLSPRRLELLAVVVKRRLGEVNAVSGR